MILVDTKDAIYWAKVVDKRLDEIVALADKLSKTLDANLTSETMEMAQDAFRLSTWVRGTKSANIYTQEDLVKIETFVEALPITARL